MCTEPLAPTPTALTPQACAKESLNLHPLDLGSKLKIYREVGQLWDGGELVSLKLIGRGGGRDSASGVCLETI